MPLTRLMRAARACLRLHLLEALLGPTRGLIGPLALADHDADEQAGHRQDQHDDLELGERRSVVAVPMQQGDEPELGRRQCRA